MKVIILAAGSGTRLGDRNTPKPLTSLITGQSILARQVAEFQDFISLDDIIVVVGFKKEQILDAFPELFFVYNPLYASENTAGSLLRALRKVDDDVLWINGDVVFEEAAVDALLESVSAENGTYVLVNSAEVNDEAVKYRTDGKGRVLEISKHVREPEGEALGMNYVARKDLPLLRDSLAQCQTNDYFEQGLTYAIQKGLKVTAVPIANDLCIEVDFPEDLARANTLLEAWSSVM